MRRCSVIIIIFVHDYFAQVVYTISEVTCDWNQKSSQQLDKQCFASYEYPMKLQCQNRKEQTEIVTPDQVFAYTPPRMSMQLLQQNNSIKSIDPNKLACYTQLFILNLDGNDLKEIENDAFSKSPRLTEIVLSNNKIKRIDPEAFKNVKKLKTLILASNAIKSISYGLLARQSNLERLDLSNNQIHLIEVNSFCQLVNLISLDLSKNQIAFIGAGIFNGTTNLRTLSLNENKITNVTDNSTFENSKKLNSLDLSSNRLIYIVSSLFANQSELQSVYLNDNSLSCPLRSWFQSISTNLSIKLNNNPWLCDNNIQVYWDYVINQEGHKMKEYDIDCKLPNNVAGKKLSSLPRSHFPEEIPLPLKLTTSFSPPPPPPTTTIKTTTTSTKHANITRLLPTTTVTLPSQTPSVHVSVTTSTRSVKGPGAVDKRDGSMNMNNAGQDQHVYNALIGGVVILILVFIFAMSIYIKTCNKKDHSKKQRSSSTLNTSATDSEPDSRQMIARDQRREEGTSSYFNQPSQDPFVPVVQVPVVQMQIVPSVRHSWSSPVLNPFVVRDPRYSSYAYSPDYNQQHNNLRQNPCRNHDNLYAGNPHGHLYEEVGNSETVRGSLV